MAKLKSKKIPSLGAILIGVCILIVLWLGTTVWDVLGLGFGAGKEVMVTIPGGANLQEISHILKEEKVIHHPFLFRLGVKTFGRNLTFQQGGHLIGKNLNYFNVAKELTDKPDKSFDEVVSVLIPEGYEIRQIASVLAEQGLVDAKVFLDELENGDFDFEFIKDIDRTENRLEGYLFPATYEIGVWETERDIIEKMLGAFETYILPLYENSGTEYSLDEVVTFASMVEREAANDSERGKVASVFYNRMKKDMTLSSCATVQYIIKERKPILSNSDIKIRSPYNTYINKGLPIGPIASPGVNSVKAVLQPESTDFLFFVARPDGSENLFSKTDTEHMRKVQMLQGS